MIQEIHVGRTSGKDALGDDVLYEIQHTLGINSVKQIRTSKVYRLEGVSEEQARQFAEQVLVDVGEIFQLNDPICKNGAHQIQVAYLPGVMNPEAASIKKCAADLGFHNLQEVDSAWIYSLYGDLKEAEIEKITSSLLVNKTIQQRLLKVPETLHIGGEEPTITTVPIRGMTDNELLELSKDQLFLNLAEMQTIQKEFQKIGRDPTDGELETLAQTWSEHCVHKTFRAPLEVEGIEKPSLMSRLRKASEKCNKGVVSSFVDNSGVIELYEGWSICGKVETHNSPSAIEPYGGAMTGSGGVFRDIMGTGAGAKVIASTDMFCVAPPDLPAEQLPQGCLHPRYLLRRIISGVRDYGNRMGIPTCNGSVHFHADFRAKPSVIVGAYGLLPTSLAKKGSPQPGDKVIGMGGRTGRDGIHGATFSSAAMTGRTGKVNASAVQIGNSIEEKRLLDALLICRDKGLIRALTDCGAGGFSSAIGELGSNTGVRVDLDLAPLKYKGMSPWEIWISESQERMVLVVEPKHVQQVLDICAGVNVEATVLGEFTNTHRLEVNYRQQKLCDLDMEFLHDGVPIPKLVARRDPSVGIVGAQPRRPGRASRVLLNNGPQNAGKIVVSSSAASHPRVPVLQLPDILKRVLAHGNVCSKEPIVRLYDHNVQGSSMLPPFVGVHHNGPADATVLAPLLGKHYGVVIAHGLNPVLTRLDPKNGSLWSAIEAISNACAVGACYEDLALIDNFIWPAPDPHWLWALDQAIEACLEVIKHLQIPFVSGKDSLSSTYRFSDGTKLDIPPVLCISVFGRIPDVRKTVSSDLKKAGSTLVVLGELDTANLAGSTYEAVAGQEIDPQYRKQGAKADIASLKNTANALYAAIQAGIVMSCHDISEGGLAVTLVEMGFGGELGIEIDTQKYGQQKPDCILFTETAGCFVIETDQPENLLQLCGKVSAKVIGKTTEIPKFVVKQGEKLLLDEKLSELKLVWQQPMREMFH